MEILPHEVARELPDLYETDHIPPHEKVVRAKLFNPAGAETWYIVEYDGDDLMFAYCDLGDPEMAEWGYVSLSELESIPGRFGLGIERDLFWKPVKFGEIKS